MENFLPNLVEEGKICHRQRRTRICKQCLDLLKLLGQPLDEHENFENLIYGNTIQLFLCHGIK